MAETFTPASGYSTSTIDGGGIESADSIIVDIDGGRIIDADGALLVAVGGIKPNDALLNASFVATDEIVVTYEAALISATPVTHSPADETATTYTRADDPTTVTWG